MKKIKIHSNRGRICIYKNNENKVVKKEKLQQYLDDGWKLGKSKEIKKKVSEESKSRCWIYNKIFDKEKFIKKEKLKYWESKGWERKRKTPSEETKKKQSKALIGRKLSEKRIENLIGKKNGMYGRIWIHNEELQKTKAIKKEELPYWENKEWIIEVSNDVKQKNRESNSGEKNGFYKKHHSIETIKKLKTFSYNGEENGMYERIWIHNKKTQENKAIKKEEKEKYLKEDWELGMSNETKRKLRLLNIKRIEKSIKNGGQISPFYNPEGCKYFNLLMEKTNTFIQHAENSGEFHIKKLGYFVDGYDKINNIVYEYDEEFHYKNEELNKRDVQRQKEIIEFLNCKFIRIKAF